MLRHFVVFDALRQQILSKTNPKRHQYLWKHQQGMRVADDRSQDEIDDADNGDDDNDDDDDDDDNGGTCVDGIYDATRFRAMQVLNYVRDSPATGS